jgi:YHS domain-containing protein
VFADLIALPLLLIYRKYYGGRTTLVLLATFWAVMSAAGLVVEGLFSALRIVPTSRPEVIAGAGIRWNYTSVLNVVFLAVFAAMYWLYRNRSRFGGGDALALDPVCGMQVEKAHAPATAVHHGTRYWFCSDHCRERFEGDPDRFAGQARREPAGSHVDPICGMTVDPAHAGATRERDGVTVYFCCAGCAETFDRQAAAT